MIDFRDTPFLETSTTAAHANRLNSRCEMLLANNRQAIEGKRVLDLASHDGRFSYACLKLGAASVTGIEGREDLVLSARKNLGQAGFDSSTFTFIHGDIFNEVTGLATGSFDTVLCLGFLYHTIKQAELFEQVRRLAPRFLILDTGVYQESRIVKQARKIVNLRQRLRGGNHLRASGPVSGHAAPCLVFRNENHEREANTIEPYDVSAIPSRSLIELYLAINDFIFTEIRWQDKKNRDWNHLDDYKSGRRISYLATLKNPSSEPSSPSS